MWEENKTKSATMLDIADINSRFEALKHTEPILRASLALAGSCSELASLKVAVCGYAELSRALMNRVRELESIRPMIYEVDGVRYRYDAPDSMLKPENK